jgi:predicted outer membrane repeat protein
LGRMFRPEISVGGGAKAILFTGGEFRLPLSPATVWPWGNGEIGNPANVPSGGFKLMRGKPGKVIARRATTAILTAGGLAVFTGIAGFAPAQAVPTARTGAVTVPCSVIALARVMASVSDGEVLSLAPHCTYLLNRGLPALSADLTIFGNDATLERSQAPGTAAFTILESDADALTINALNFKNGAGAITMLGGELTVNGGTFSGNTAADGGAIFEPFTGLNAPVVSDATFIANRATDSGGAIYDGDAGLDGVTAINCVFSGNQATNYGGAIFDFSIYQEISGSVFRGNRAEYGGAVLVDPDAGADLSNDVFEGNSATGDGGGIYSFYSVSIENGKISGNHADGQGGGLYSGPMGFDDSAMNTEFAENSAADGGAIGNFGASGVDLTEVTIARNRASQYGGGIDNESYVAAVNTLISRNGAGSSGGGIYSDVNNENYFMPTLTNSAVVDNEPDNCVPLGSITGCVG